MKLISSNQVDITAVDAKGNTLLHHSVLKQHRPLVQLLILKNAPIDPENLKQQTPLHLAIKAGNVSITKVLLQGGAAIHKADRWGHDAISHAVHHKDTTMLHLLFLMGGNGNSKDNNGNTPLHHAVDKEYLGIVEILLSNNCDPNIQDSKGNTALHYAAKKNSSIYLLLLKNGAEMFVENNEHETPADIARRKFGRVQRMAERHPHRYNNIPVPPKKWIIFPVLFYAVSMMTLYYGGWIAFVVVVGVIRWAMLNFLRWPGREKRTYFFVTSTIMIFIGVCLVWYLLILPDLPGYQVEAMCYALYSVLGLVAYFICVLKYSNPGVINVSDEYRRKDKEEFLRDIDEESHRPLTICGACNIRRPLRSKHCRQLNMCVAKFDHFCPWINNSVGLENHHSFMVSLILTVFGFVWFLRWAVLDVMLTYNKELTWWSLGELYLGQHRMLTVFILQSIVLGAFLGFQLIRQFIMICTNLTVNEMFHSGQYQYLKKNNQFQNPFSKGTVVGNISDYLQPSFDYYSVFYVSSLFSEPKVTVI
uniref:Palmitoyltransferase n=1 Tax=Arcella intermedia TaxID=1963864 RepID=A0A6B2L194_9EUKA